MPLQKSAGVASKSLSELKSARQKRLKLSNFGEPGLQGKVVIELKVSPAGTVTDCQLVSSELKLHELEAKLLARIRQFDFGAKEVDLMVVTWPLDFLPS